MLQTNINDDPNIGLYGFATDKYCFLGIREKEGEKLRSELKVPLISSTILYTELSGIFCSGNSYGIVLPKIVEDFEFAELQNALIDNLDVFLMESVYTAMGNLILMNDNGIIISSWIKRHAGKLERFFGLPCAVSRIADMNIVGKLGIATNNGVLLHHDARENEIKIIEKVLGVQVDVGTAGFGSGFVGASIIANRNGYIASMNTTGIELGRISKALGFG